MRCNWCGSYKFQGNTCVYCGTVIKIKEKIISDRVVVSNKGEYKTLYNTKLIWNRNEIGYAENCKIVWNRNTIKKSKNIIVIWNRNTY